MHICLASWGLCARNASPDCQRRQQAAERTVKVLDLEDAGTALSGSSLELGGVDLDEAQTVEVVTEELADARLHAEDGLVGGGAEVHDAVVKTGGQAHARVLEALVLLGLKVSHALRT